MPQDGPTQQDGERAAGTRWLAKQAARRAPHGVTFLGDALSSHQPFCPLVRHHGGNVILTCTPASHPKCYERLACWQAAGGVAEHDGRRWNGRYTEATLVRSINDVLLRGGDAALAVNWCARTVGKTKTGAQLSPNSFITHHRLSADNIAAVAHAGRGRWKIENENHTVLKTKGDHLAHHCGHGQQYLAAVMLSLNLLALLFHTVREWSDHNSALLRQVLARRQTFFHDIQAFMRYMVFTSWEHLLTCMMQGLELASRCDTG